MKLYDGKAPNPKRVRVFMHEKGIEVPSVELDVLGGDTRTPDFLKINSIGEVPALELDDGRVITESIAICRYLESQRPEPPLFGRDAADQARVEMWNRRIEFGPHASISAIGRHVIPFFADKLEQNPEYAEQERRVLAKELTWLDADMADGRPFFTGDDFTVADITGMIILVIGEFIDTPIPDELSNLKAWEGRVRARPSWSA